MSFACDTCFDTETVDFGGAEVPCPDCLRKVVVKITGLGWGLGLTGRRYATAVQWSNSTITFEGVSKNAIIQDVVAVANHYKGEARKVGLKGRNSVSSGAIAIENRVRVALKGI